jgi:uncharacterized protein involved in response to NO
MRNAKLPVKPVWQLPFRPLFLLGTLFSCLILLLWVAQLSGLIHLKTFGPAVTWHAHEMLFGFTMAIVVGFLLTAVRNWTGKASAMGPALKLMVFLWCLSRFLWLFEQSPIWLVALCDAAFPLYAAYWMAKPLRGAKQPHNQYFVLLLIVLGIGQLVYHLLLNEAVQYISVFQQSMVLVMANLVFWVGGRVLPFFVQAKLSIPKRELPSWLTPAAMTCSWSLIPLFLTQQTILLTVFGFLSALLHTLRLLLFYRWGVLKEPMLWSIFVAPLWIVLGFMALALGSANWLHLITVGGLGGMILSMISRVSLGHSGEPIRALKWMPIAFIFMSIASVTRFFANDIQLFTGAGYTFSALLWVCAFGCFIVHYHKRLLAP